MVLGAYDKYVTGPRKEAIKRADLAEERVEERVKQAKEQANIIISAWNERRLQAEANGEPFNEPLPSAEEL